MTRPEFDPHRELNLADLQVKGPPSVQQNDMDHDGRIDHILYDLDGDGQIERMEVDENGDGRIDTVYQWTTHPGEHTAVFHDYDHDGKFENIWMDTNADGKIDEIREDPNEDGNPEKVSRDTDFNGSFERIDYDDNSDGEVDRIGYDPDGDGKPNLVLPSRHSADIHAVGTGGHINPPAGTSGDFAFGSGEGVRHLSGSDEMMGTTEVPTFGAAPAPATSFGSAPAVTTVGSAPQEALFSHPTAGQETFGAGPAHLIPTNDDGSPESPFADQPEPADDGHEPHRDVAEALDPHHHALTFHDPDGTDG